MTDFIESLKNFCCFCADWLAQSGMRSRYCYNCYRENSALSKHYYDQDSNLIVLDFKDINYQIYLDFLTTSITIKDYEYNHIIEFEHNLDFNSLDELFSIVKIQLAFQ